jgi:hypothetical protein
MYVIREFGSTQDETSKIIISEVCCSKACYSTLQFSAKETVAQKTVRVYGKKG